MRLTSALLIYVGDLATPRARVSLADLLSAERPLNLRRRAGETILLIAEHAGIDLEDAARAKLVKNAAKYPVETSHGSSRKYVAGKGKAC